jgi:hypothetical protein
MIIIGLGSGRCGTRSLASLLNAQPDTVCFHEINPSCMAWTGTERTVLSMLEEFRAVLAGGPRQITVDLATRRRADQLPRLRSLGTVTAIGDVAFYYLAYAPILAEMPDVTMPVLRRDKDATVASFVEVMRIRRGRIRTLIDGAATLMRRRPYRRFRNHWVEHDGRRWRRSAKFDKCFPKFQADTLEDAVAEYWNLYYRTAEELAARYPEKIRIFDLDDLNMQSGQRAILEFCGLRQPVFHPVHANVNGRTGDPMLAAAPAMSDQGESGAGS